VNILFFNNDKKKKIVTCYSELDDKMVGQGVIRPYKLSLLHSEVISDNGNIQVYTVDNHI